MSEMLTPAQVAEKMQVAEYTVLKWVREGKIPATKIGKTIRIPADALNPKVG